MTWYGLHKEINSLVALCADQQPISTDFQRTAIGLANSSYGILHPTLPAQYRQLVYQGIAGGG
jgi:hypothetical protein